MSGELERLAAACIFPSFPGHSAPGWILERIDQGLGGICLFSYNVGDREQLAGLTASLRAGRPDLLIGIDEEGGDVTRLETGRGSSSPGNGALGAVDDPALTREVAASIGAELAAAGINLDFAPVADINVNPANPVIGVRSFGSDPELVSRHVAAFVDGLQTQGVAACAKHFPGHGSTEQDSHLELPVVTDDVRDGFGPFVAAIDAGVQSIMTAHVKVPALDEAPATLSPAIVQGLLRNELGYDGLVIADALEMKAVSETVGIERSAVLAVAAGVDSLLMGHDLGEDSVAVVHKAIVEAVTSGLLPEERLREAAERVARVGRWATSAQLRGAVEGSPGRLAAQRALQVRDDVTVAAAPLVIELRPRANIAAGEAEHSFGSVLAERLPGTEGTVLDETSADVGETIRLHPGRPVVIVIRDAHRHGWMREASAVLVAAAPGAVVVEIGMPIWQPERARGYLATFGGSRASFEAASDRLLGASSTNGAGR